MRPRKYSFSSSNTSTSFFLYTISQLFHPLFLRSTHCFTSSFYCISILNSLMVPTTYFRNSCQSQFFGSDYVITYFLSVILFHSNHHRVNSCWFFFFFVPTADVRFVLGFQSCYPAIPASKIPRF